MSEGKRRAFYKSKAWEQCRAAYAASRGGLCERCMAHGLYNAGEIVHHRVHLNDENLSDPTVALAWDNLELLCRDCHNKEHFDTKRYEISDDGRVFIG